MICRNADGAGVMSADKLKSGIPKDVIEDLARTLLPSIRKFFESEEGQREFAEWKEQQARNEGGSEKPLSPVEVGEPII